MKKKDLNLYLSLLERNQHGSIVYAENISPGKIFLASKLSFIANKLNSEQLKYFLDNYQQIKIFEDNYSLEVKTLIKYIKFFSSKNYNINLIIPNKKVKVTEKVVKEKIIGYFSLISYDVDSLNIKIGNVNLVCFRIAKNTYEVKKTINNDYVTLLIIHIDKLKLRQIVF